MAIRQLHTPSGIVLAEYKDEKELLKEELAVAVSNEQKIAAIIKYLGVL